MKKISFLLLISFFSLVFALSPSEEIAYADDQTTTEEDRIDEIIEEIDLSEYQALFDSLSLLDREYSFKELFKSVLHNEFPLDFPFFLSYILQCFTGNLNGLIAEMLIIILLVVFMSMMQKLSSGFAKESTRKIVYIACYGTVITLVCLSVGSTIKTMTESLYYMTRYTETVFPVLLALVTTIGATASVAVYQPLLLLFSQLIVKITEYIVMPAFYVSFVFALLGNLSDDIKLEKISETAKQIGNWVLGLVFGLFMTYSTAQGITGASMDSMAAKSAKYALGNYVPVIGSSLKDGFDLIISACIVIKNGIGFISVVLLLLYMLTPILKIATLSLSLKLTGAICEPFGDKKISNMLTSVSKSLTLPLLVCICMTFSIIIFLMLILLTCNKGVL